MNPHGPCGPTDFHARLRLSPPLLSLPQGLGSGLSLHHVPDLAPCVRCCPSSLYTFPTRFGPGLARDRHFTGFLDFEQFCTAGFPTGTQVLSFKSDASADWDQRGLNNLSLSSQLALRRRRRCNSRGHLRRFVGEPYPVKTGAYPNVNEKTSTPGSRNSISKVTSLVGPSCRTS